MDQGTKASENIELDEPSRRTPAWGSLPIQFFGGGAILGTTISTLSLIGAGELYDGFLSLVGSAIVGATLAVPAMILAALLGLPLRIVPALRRWWMSTGSIVALALAVAGLAGILLSYILGTEIFVTSDQAGVPEGYVRDPSPAWYFGSIAVAAVGLCHMMFPLPRKRRRLTQ